MKSAEDLEGVLLGELGWRKKELLQIRLQARAAPDWALSMHVRSGITMLYAHWEGFVKAAGEALVEFVRDQNLDLGELAPGYVAIALRKEFSEIRDSKAGSLAPEMAAANTIADGYFKQAVLKPRGSIPTASNLSWKQFSLVAARLGLDVTDLQLQEHLINERLVGKRNTIAHGDKSTPLDRTDFVALHAKIVAMLDRISHQVMRVAEDGRYRL